jgi:ATP-dependent helicase/nuclease subunit A
MPAPPPLRPSNALQGAEEVVRAASPSPRRVQALEEGRQIHRLLQYLPDIPEIARREAALRDLAAQGAAPARAEGLAESVLRVLDDIRLAPLFGEASLAEARFSARLPKAGGGFLEIAGAIDRLAETAEAVWLVDYKTGGSLAENESNQKGGEAATTQLALYRAAVAMLYPGKPIRCFLVFTSGPVIAEIQGPALDEALAKILR